MKEYTINETREALIQWSSQFVKEFVLKIIKHKDELLSNRMFIFNLMKWKEVRDRYQRQYEDFIKDMMFSEWMPFEPIEKPFNYSDMLYQYVNSLEN